MKITHLAHACMLVETNGIRLVSDPWLNGPTFSGSWWQFPPPKLRAADLGKLDFIYLSHSHRDHQHEPSLQAIDKSATVIIPKLADKEQYHEVRALGFDRIIEVGHKEKIQLGNGTELVLFQTDWDSAVLIHDGRSTVFNANDCPFLHYVGAVKSFYPKIDVAFLPFLDARDFPAVYDLSGASFSGSQAEQDEQSMQLFIQGAARLQPEAVVPFASHKIFVRPDQRYMNGRKTPLDLRHAFDAAPELKEKRIAFFDMNSTDTWETGTGFTRRNPFDWSTYPAELEKFYIAEQPVLDEVLASQPPYPNFTEAFRVFAQEILSQNSVLRTFFINYKLAFEFTDQPEKFWLLDFRSGTLTGAQAAEPHGYDVKYTTTSFLFGKSMLDKAEYWEDTMLSNLVFVKVGAGIPYYKIKFLKVFFNAKCSEAKFYKVVTRKVYDQLIAKLTAA